MLSLSPWKVSFGFAFVAKVICKADISYNSFDYFASLQERGRRFWTSGRLQRVLWKVEPQLMALPMPLRGRPWAKSVVRGSYSVTTGEVAIFVETYLYVSRSRL